MRAEKIIQRMDKTQLQAEIEKQEKLLADAKENDDEAQMEKCHKQIKLLKVQMAHLEDKKSESYKTDNVMFGFYGTVKTNLELSDADAAKAYDEAGKTLSKLLGLSQEQTVKALDSKFGRHFADKVSDQKAGYEGIKPALAEFTKEQATKWFPKTSYQE